LERYKHRKGCQQHGSFGRHATSELPPKVPVQRPAAVL
jgi:hypothetical protein